MDGGIGTDGFIKTILISIVKMTVVNIGMEWVKIYTWGALPWRNGTSVSQPLEKLDMKIKGRKWETLIGSQIFLQ